MLYVDASGMFDDMMFSCLTAAHNELPRILKVHDTFAVVFHCFSVQDLATADLDCVAFIFGHEKRGESLVHNLHTPNLQHIAALGIRQELARLLPYIHVFDGQIISIHGRNFVK